MENVEKPRLSKTSFLCGKYVEKSSKCMCVLFLLTLFPFAP